MTQEELEVIAWGCHDGYCLVGKLNGEYPRKGMHTNGGCKCVERIPTLVEEIRRLHKLLDGEKSMPHPPKCRIEGGEPVFCDTLYNLLGNPHGKGLGIFEVTTMATGKSRCAGVCYKKSSKDLGMLLNVCPWCKESLEFWSK